MTVSFTILSLLWRSHFDAIVVTVPLTVPLQCDCSGGGGGGGVSVLSVLWRLFFLKQFCHCCSSVTVMCVV